MLEFKVKQDYFQCLDSFSLCILFLILFILPEALRNWAKVWKIQKTKFGTRLNDMKVRIFVFNKLRSHGHVLNIYCEN